jgi:hypothetical protein
MDILGSLNLVESQALWLMLVIQQVEIRRIVASSGKISPDPILINKPCMVAHVCHPSYVGNVNKRIVVQASLGKNMRLY